MRRCCSSRKEWIALQGCRSGIVQGTSCRQRCGCCRCAAVAIASSRGDKLLSSLGLSLQDLSSDLECGLPFRSIVLRDGGTPFANPILMRFDLGPSFRRCLEVGVVILRQVQGVLQLLNGVFKALGLHRQFVGGIVGLTGSTHQGLDVLQNGLQRSQP